RGCGQGEVARPRDDDLAGAVLAGHGLPLRVAEHDRTAGLHDRELLRRDLLTGLAEDVHVVERHIREHDYPRAQDVSRGGPPAEPGLDDGAVGLRLGDRGESRRREHLELRRIFRPWANVLDRGLEVRLVAVDADALAPGAY